MRLIYASILFSLLSTNAVAEPVLIFDGGGKLTGATGVEILGESYNVAFVDGTCAQFYDGCDESFDFFFTSEGVANEASRALAQQVFPGVTPTSIQGCSSTNGNDICRVYTPWNILSPADVTVSIAAVIAPDDARFVGNSRIGANIDLGDSPSSTFAIWSWPVDPPPRCADGIDNDGDGSMDFPNDAGCSDSNDDNEADATLIFDNEGRVIGATNVPVLGQELSVEFRDGTCVALFDGCDEESDFFFTSEGTANEASRALAMHVLPALAPKVIEGCGPGAVGTCSIYTPRDTSVIASLAALVTPDDARFVGNTLIGPNLDLSTDNRGTYAIWFASNLSPTCDIQMSQATYIDGETVTADVFRIANLTSAPIAAEWKVWLGVSGFPPISIINLGADGSLVLPAGFDADLGPVPLVPVTADLPRGNYEFSCRMLDPVTGELLWEDFNSFDIQ